MLGFINFGSEMKSYFRETQKKEREEAETLQGPRWIDGAKLAENSITPCKNFLIYVLFMFELLLSFIFFLQSLESTFT